MIFFCFGGSLLILNKNTLLVHKIMECHIPSGSDDEGDLGLGVNIEVSFLLGGSLGINDILVFLGVLSCVLLGVLGSNLSGGSTILLSSSTGINTGLEELGVSGLFLHNVLWDNSCPKQNTKT